MTTTNIPRNAKSVDSYLALVQEQPLRAIRTRKDYDVAARMIDRLAVHDVLDDGQQQYLDAIEVLVEAYEHSAIPVTRDRRTPLQRLQAVGVPGIKGEHLAARAQAEAQSGDDG